MYSCISVTDVALIHKEKISAINGVWQPNKTLRNVIRISMGVATYILAICALNFCMHEK